MMFPLIFLNILLVSISAQLDLNSIKKQQTYPITTPTTTTPTTTTSTTTTTPTTTPTTSTTTTSTSTTTTTPTTTPTTTETTTTTITISTTTTVGLCNVGCQDGWVPYSGNCYKKMDGVLTQSTAEQECIGIGSHLASFETTEEATAIRNLVLSTPLFSNDLSGFTSSSQDSWIGLSKTSNGAWTWTDSSDVEFTNLPDGTSVTGDSCVSMNISGMWYPKDCSSTVPSFICKMTSSSTS